MTIEPLPPSDPRAEQALREGCAGLRRIEAGLGEVKRVWVAEAVRRQGLGRRLMSEIERRARERGIRELRLDTRSDLVESRRLYERLGYREVEPFGENPYAAHWFVKHLGEMSPEAR